MWNQWQYLPDNIDMELLAIIIAFGLYHFVEKPTAMRSFNWLEKLRLYISQWLPEDNGNFILTVILPLFLLYVILVKVFAFSDDSLPAFLVDVLLVYYCLGPDTIDKMVNQHNTKNKLDLPANATAEQLINKLTDAALHRWFGVFFWFLVLGVYGALLYRGICYFSKVENQNVKTSATNTLKVMEFPVIILMTLSLALASDFDRIWQHCKQYLNIETLKTLNSQFMYKSMDFAVEQCEIEESDENKANIVELTTYTVLKRMLVVWLVFSALMVIFSIG
jgi:AmpE protein